ncbi:MAG: hypothetical protein IJ435_03775 [Clostridia bacterium]|nr:hypothetical protein [Clostridia bacterium]
MFELPESFVIDGSTYPINTDFLTWVEIGELMGKEKTSENIGKMLLLCFPEKKMPPLAKTIEEILKFYRREKNAAENKTKEKKPVFDLVYDFGLVSAAFFSQYKINLRKDKLHWWLFWELFEGLKSEEKIIKVIGYRAADVSKIKNKEEKKHIKKMQEIYKLPSKKLADDDVGYELSKLF